MFWHFLLVERTQCIVTLVLFTITESPKTNPTAKMSTPFFFLSAVSGCSRLLHIAPGFSMLLQVASGFLKFLHISWDWSTVHFGKLSFPKLDEVDRLMPSSMNNETLKHSLNVHYAYWMIVIFNSLSKEQWLLPKRY